MRSPDPRPVYLRHGSSKLVPYMLDDVAKICADLRASDELDIAAATRLSPAQAISLCARRSEPCYTLLSDEMPAAVIGVEKSKTEGVGSCWLIGTTRFERAMRAGLAKRSADWFSFITADYSFVFNFVPVANQGDLRWLDHLGFERGALVENYRDLGETCQEVHRDLTNGRTGRRVPRHLLPEE